MPKAPRRGRSYDQLMVRAVMGAKPVTPAVALGQFCVTHNVSVEEVATRLGVTRPTVYAWFTGVRQPRPGKLASLIELLAVLRASL